METEQIKTKRLVIRRFCPEDWKDMQNLWMDAAKSEYAKYDWPNDTDDDAVIRRINSWSSYADSSEHRFLAVCLGERVIGFAALHRSEDSCEIGYIFHSAYHGQGYATESIRGIIEKLRTEGVRRLTAGTALANSPSVRLLQALGFSQVGTEQVSFYQDEQGRPIYFEGGLYECELG